MDRIAATNKPLAMNTRKILSYILLTVAITAVSECSVKEDRQQCPCRLTLDISDGRRVVPEECLSILLINEDSSVEADTRLKPDNFPKGWQKDVKKGIISICALKGVKACTKNAASLLAPERGEFDRIFFYHSHANCTGETARDTVRLRKAFAEIAVELPDPTNTKHQFDITAECLSSGIDITTSKPTGGKMSVLLKSDHDKALRGDFHPVQDLDTIGRSNRLFRFICPRQNDYSMRILLHNKNGELTYSIPIGEMLKDNEYSWDTQNLKDAFIKIDRAKVGISVKISDWNKGEEKEITI